MAKNKARTNVLLFDVFKAHAEYGKKVLESTLKVEGVSVFVKYDLKNINRYIAENNISYAVLFIYDANHYHQLVAFEAIGLKVLVCSSVHDMHQKALEEMAIPFLDMGLPKKELFQGVREFLVNNIASDAVA
ncbi:hypothetical protein [Flagellimonas marinaquae]